MTIIVDAGTPFQSGATSNSIAVTIPAGANFVYVYVDGYLNDVGAPAAFFGKLNFSNTAAQNDFTLVGRQAFSTNDWQIEAWRIDSTSPNWPGTGSKTLYYDTRSGITPAEGLNIYVGALSNADTAAPIVSSGVTSTGSNAASPKTVSLSGVGANDVTIIGGYAFTAVTDASGNGQTELWRSSVLTNAALTVAYKFGENSPQIASSVTSGLCGVAFAVKDGGSAAPNSTICQISDVRRQPMLRGPY